MTDEELRAKLGEKPEDAALLIEAGRRWRANGYLPFQVPQWLEELKRVPVGGKGQVGDIRIERLTADGFRWDHSDAVPKGNDFEIHVYSGENLLFTTGAGSSDDLGPIMRMIGVYHQAVPQLRVAIYSYTHEKWCKPDGTWREGENHWNMETQVQSAGLRF